MGRIFDGISPNHQIVGSMFDPAKTLCFIPLWEPKMPGNKQKSVVYLLHEKSYAITKYVTVWKSRRTLSPTFLGSMFDTMALSPVFAFDVSAQLPDLPQMDTHRAERVGIFCNGAEAKVDHALRRFLAVFARFSALKTT